MSWLGQGIAGLHEKLEQIDQGVSRLFNRPQQSRRVYVTLRGYYVEGTTVQTRIAHGWTQYVNIMDGQDLTVTFPPYRSFETERVDILGPADITGVNVGNEAKCEPKFMKPATFEFRSMVEVGSLVHVYIQGTP